MHPIEEYAKNKSLSVSQLSKLWGVSQPMLSFICCGKRNPSPRTIEKIMRATNGELGKEQLITLPSEAV